MTDRNQHRETAAAWHFHAVTKYVRPNETSVASIMMGEAPNLGPAIGEQNPAIEPFPYKIYTDLAPIPLPRDFPEMDLPALAALAASGDLPAGTAIPNLESVARLCLRSNGLLKRWRSQAGREIEFRAAGCTGARYHLELYLVSGDLPGLAAGVYHYAAHDHSLRLLRGGDYRAIVAEATGQETPPSGGGGPGGERVIVTAPVVAIWSSTFWRNAWRYQARAYRHVYWDTATALANMLAVAAEEALPAQVVLGFADPAINALLDVDGQREAAVCLVALGKTSRESEVGSREGQSDSRLPTPDFRPAIAPLGFATQPLSAREIDFPEIGAMHDASSLATGAEARAWRSAAFRPERPEPTGPLIPLAPLAPASLPAEPIDEVIARRRSNRHYLAESPLSFAALSTVIATALTEPAMDCLIPGAPPLYTPYLIVNNVEGLQPGAYVVHPQAMALELLKPDDSRSAGSSLACFQDYADAAHVNAYTLTDLEPVLAHFGNRGYRLAQLEAALFGAKLQLAAHALGLGAVGSTSYDDDVTAYFSPHAAGKSFMFIAVFGHKRRPSTTEVAAKSGFLQPKVTGDG